MGLIISRINDKLIPLLPVGRAETNGSSILRQVLMAGVAAIWIPAFEPTLQSEGMKKIIRIIRCRYDIVMACLAWTGLIASAANLIIQAKEEDALSIFINAVVIGLFLFFSIKHTIRHIRKRNKMLSRSIQTNPNQNI